MKYNNIILSIISEHQALSDNLLIFARSIMILFIIAVFFKAIYNTYKLNKEGIEFRKILKKGDKVYYSQLKGEIIDDVDINDEYVFIKIKARKDSIYEDKEKN